MQLRVKSVEKILAFFFFLFHGITEMPPYRGFGCPVQQASAFTYCMARSSVILTDVP